jgi:ribosome-associated protein
MTRLAADAIADKKGFDVVVLDVADLIQITDFFIIATGSSRPHVQSLAENVEEKLKQAGQAPLREEGRPEAEWVLLDYGDFVVHLFQPQQRDFYGLERLWRDAPEVKVAEAVSDRN